MDLLVCVRVLVICGAWSVCSDVYLRVRTGLDPMPKLRRLIGDAGATFKHFYINTPVSTYCKQTHATSVIVIRDVV